MALTKRQKKALSRATEAVYADTKINANYTATITARLRLAQYGGDAAAARDALVVALAKSGYQMATSPGITERYRLRKVLKCSVRGSVHGTSEMARLFELVFLVGLGEW